MAVKQIQVRRVVVTGMGAVTPLGNSVTQFWQGIRQGRLGFGEITLFDPTGFPVTIAAQAWDFKPEDYLVRREYSRMDRFSQLAMVAAAEAMAQSGIEGKIDPGRIGVLLGSGVGGFDTMEKETNKLSSKGPTRVGMLMVPMIISNMAAGNIAIRFQAKGHCSCVVTACATGSNAIGDAFHHIAYGLSDAMICGGAEAPITSLSISGFAALTTLNKGTDINSLSIPFDKRRDGFVMGEGAGVLVLEELEHAKARGASILAEIVGYGSAGDAYHMTAPEPSGDGAVRAMRQALDEAELLRVDYINAHGTSTQYNDKIETLAVKEVFGEEAYRIPVSSTKSMTGHLLGAAGAVEAIIGIKAIEDRFLPPTMGYQQPDPECDLDYVPNQGREAKVDTVLSNSMGFGGHNVAVIFKRYEG